MKLADLSTGPDWIVWLLKKKSQNINEKKLCRIMGIGMSVIATLLLIMGLLESVSAGLYYMWRND